MIGTVGLRMTVYTPFIEREDVESGNGLMTPQHMHMALLAKLVASGLEQAFVI